MIDFDQIDDWAPRLSDTLTPHIPDSTPLELTAAAPEYIEDARDVLFDLTDRDVVIGVTLNWIRSTDIVGYHGSRLTDEEIASVRSNGLIPLRAEARRQRLVRTLSAHPRWPEVASQLESAIQSHGPGSAAGLREGQVHLTLSRRGLVDGFNHYLTYGSELAATTFEAASKDPS